MTARISTCSVIGNRSNAFSERNVNPSRANAQITRERGWITCDVHDPARPGLKLDQGARHEPPRAVREGSSTMRSMLASRSLTSAGVTAALSTSTWG